MVDENVYYVNTKSRTGIAITNHPDAQWFPKAGFGLFMHWGISAVDGDLDISWGMMKDFQYSPRVTTPEDYFALAEKFNPHRWDPDKILKAAKEAGMRYAVLTTRHHDSYALWPSDYGSFNTGVYMDGRDLVGEYVDACRKNGIKVGLYYSPPDFYSGRRYMEFGGWYKDKEPTPEVMNEYIKIIAKGQIRELLTRYGKIDLIWFDGVWQELYTYEELLELQPGIVIGRGKDSHFDSIECTLPTEELYQNKLKGNWWECCHELNNSWGYTSADEWHLKSAETIIDWLKLVRGYEGNLLLNIGPDGNGKLPDLAYTRLKEIGEFIKNNPDILPEWDEG